jgi:hypothetical protein
VLHDEAARVANEEYKAADMELRRQRLEEESMDGYAMDGGGTVGGSRRGTRVRGASWDDDRFSYLRRRSSLGSHPGSARLSRRGSGHGSGEEGDGSATDEEGDRRRRHRHGGDRVPLRRDGSGRQVGGGRRRNDSMGTRSASVATGAGARGGGSTVSPVTATRPSEAIAIPVAAPIAAGGNVAGPGGASGNSSGSSADTRPAATMGETGEDQVWGVGRRECKAAHRRRNHPAIRRRATPAAPLHADPHARAISDHTPSSVGNLPSPLARPRFSAGGAGADEAGPMSARSGANSAARGRGSATGGLSSPLDAGAGATVALGHDGRPLRPALKRRGDDSVSAGSGVVATATPTMTGVSARSTAPSARSSVPSLNMRALSAREAAGVALQPRVGGSSVLPGVQITGAPPTVVAAGAGKGAINPIGPAFTSAAVQRRYPIYFSVLIKKNNAKKHHSHRWFFEAFCQVRGRRGGGGGGGGGGWGGGRGARGG